MSWRDELKHAVAQDNARIGMAETEEQDPLTAEQHQRQAAIDLFRRQIIPGIEDFVVALNREGREASFDTQLENIDPRVRMYLLRREHNYLRLWIVAEVTANGFTMKMRDDVSADRGTHYAFPMKPPAVTRDAVAAAIAKAYQDNLTGRR
jgi:hypothetical protein